MTTKKNSPAIEDEAEEREESAAVAEQTSEDIESLLSADPEFFDLASGTQVRIRRLKTVETLRLLKILTVGAGGAISRIDWSSLSNNAEAFAGELVALLLMAVPNAVDETLQFIQSMVEPIDLIERPRSKAERDSNQERWEVLGNELINPEIEDTIGILTNVVRQEAKDIQALGKRLRAMLPMALNS